MQCTKCPAVLSTIYKLKRHMETSIKCLGVKKEMIKKIFQCEYCLKIISSKQI